VLSKEAELKEVCISPPPSPAWIFESFTLLSCSPTSNHSQAVSRIEYFVKLVQTTVAILERYRDHSLFAEAPDMADLLAFLVQLRDQELQPAVEAAAALQAQQGAQEEEGVPRTDEDEGGLATPA